MRPPADRPAAKAVNDGFDPVTATLNYPAKTMHHPSGHACPPRAPATGPTTAVVVFDFDGTLTERDTILPFLRAAAGDGPFLRGLPALLPALLTRGLGLLGRTATKERLFARYLSGRPLDEVRAAGLRFAHDRLPGMLRPAALRRLEWHRAEGHRCLVVTASPELYVAPWAAARGIEAIGSRLAVDAAGRLTGRHDGPPCEGPEKLRRLQALVGPDARILHAYGDSCGDAALLRAAEHAHWRQFPAAAP